MKDATRLRKRSRKKSCEAKAVTKPVDALPPVHISDVDSSIQWRMDRPVQQEISVSVMAMMLKRG